MNALLSVPTGLLSENEEAFLEGDHEVENPEQYMRNLRHRSNQRIQQIPKHLQLLEEAGHDDLVAQFYYQIDPTERLRDEVRALQAEVEALHEVLDDEQPTDD